MIKNNLCTNVQLYAEKVMKTFSAHFLSGYIYPELFTALRSKQLKAT